MAGDVAAPHRRTRRRRADHRGRAFRRRRNRIHPAARHRDAAFGAAAVLARPGTVRLQRAAAGARFFAARHARPLPCAVARAAHAPAIRSRAALRLDRIREDAANGRRPEQSLRQSRVMPNANSAHITQLGDDWESFYRARRSSATRRRDRTKRKHLSEFGEIRFETVAEPDELRQTLDTLWEQKKPDLCAQGNSRHLCAARLSGVFRRFRRQSEFAASGARQPRADRLRPARRQISRSCSATATITCCRAIATAN